MSNDPDYTLTIADKGSGARSNAGVAWKNSKGGINISLNPGFVLDWRMSGDYWITLWPTADKQNELLETLPSDKRTTLASTKYGPGDIEHPDDDDSIPF